MDEIAEVEALESGQLIVWSKDNSRKLYNKTFYGKPLGNPKPEEDFEEPLILDAIEGVYLLEKGLIKVKIKNREIKFNQLLKVAREQLDRFDEKYKVYKDLRERGLVVTPGLKYGCDFAVYKHGPGIDHAPYVVQVEKLSNELGATDIVKAGRLASTVKKTFIIAIEAKEQVDYLEFRWWKA